MHLSQILLSKWLFTVDNYPGDKRRTIVTEAETRAEAIAAAIAQLNKECAGAEIASPEIWSLTLVGTQNVELFKSKRSK